MSARRRPGAVIVGAAETDAVGKLPTHSTLMLHLEAARNALADAGLTIHDIDGVAGVSAPGPLTVAHALGITPRWLDTTSVGGTSFLFHVRHAAAAIAAGLCTTVLITHGESGRSRVGAPAYARDPASLMGQFEAPYGVMGPPTTLTVPALRYLHETGTTQEQLAEVPVAQRRWAARNPRAMFREEITVDDVFASPMIAYPFHLLECCLVTDGGGALIVTSADRARDLPQRHRPVHLLGAGEASDAPIVSQMADLTSSQGFRLSGQAAFEEAGINVDDVDHLMIYDAFAHLPLYGLEDLGFVKRGEAGAFIADGHTSPGGSLPLNTNGGGLSYTHTGMYGMFAICESVRQLRGEAAAQVPDPQISVVLGNGGMFMSAATLVLGTDATT
ncbi:thiolase [Nocardioides sp. DS6]|uniref:Thiolase n=1 Tax=Nocardioides eburneus TaxID=3231482 RepID=A0ABV3SXZ7_9ACTN